MGVAVLKPEDCLRFPNPMKHPKNPFPNTKPNRTNRTQPNRKKRSPNTSPPPPRPTAGRKVPAQSLVMGQVRILKRGEDLKKTTPEKHVRFEKENVDADLASANRLGPDPRSVRTQIRLTESNNNSNKKVFPSSFYAGSAFITSPPPSSVPMPAFFTKKIGVAVKKDDATSDLRRILRLDL